jgi:hypothetical protein
MNMTRNSKEHPNTIEELREQAKMVKENLALFSDGVNDPQQHILQCNILEIVNNLSPLSKAVPNFGDPLRSSRKRTSEGGSGGATPSPAKRKKKKTKSPAAH